MTRCQLRARTIGRAAGAVTSLAFRMPRYTDDHRPQRSRVGIFPASFYSVQLETTLWEAIHIFEIAVRGKSVLLKPNLVDYISGVHINTHPRVVGAAVECFRRLGASNVIVAEGPGHQRDTELLLAESGLGSVLKDLKVDFVDLNRDDVMKVPLRANYSGLKELWLPKTVMSADFIVSMPKVKTHHWSGVTLSMKNMFGVVPGVKYGWPKNILHWRGIDRCIIDVVATVPVHFVIADTIICMEGNGPLAGTARALNRLVLSDDPVAADATCARLMGLLPERVPHIRETGKFLGNLAQSRIDQLGWSLLPPAVPFATVPEFEHLRGSSADVAEFCR